MIKNIFLLFFYIVMISKSSADTIDANIDTLDIKEKIEKNVDIISEDVYYPSPQVVRPNVGSSSPHIVTQHKPISVTKQPKEIETPKIKSVTKSRNVRVTHPPISSSNLSSGFVIYQIPEIMKYRKTYTVRARISNDSLGIYQDIDGDVIESSIPITNSMIVELKDPSPKDDPFFDIVSYSNVQQIDTASGTYTEWVWDVTPIKSGKSKLVITVSILRDGVPKTGVYSSEVVVKTSTFRQILFWLSKNPEWLLSVLLIPLLKVIISAIYKKIKTRST